MSREELAVFVPWRPTPDRIPAFRLMKQEWEALDFIVYTVDSHPDYGFNLAAARNEAVSICEALGQDVAVIADADTFCDADALYESIDQAKHSQRVHLPYTQYRSLGIDGTRQLEAGMDPQDCSHLVVDIACSGIFVSTPKTWWSIGGMDERFTVWAPEDWAFRLAHEAFLGPQIRHAGNAYAMHHNDQPSKASGPAYDECVALYKQYLDAGQDIIAMNELLRGRRR